MKRIKFLKFIAFILFVIPIKMQAQTGNSAIDKLYRQALDQYERGNFLDAAGHYKELINRDPGSFLYNYELGLLYFYELHNKKE